MELGVSSDKIEGEKGTSLRPVWRLGEIATVDGAHCGVRGQSAPIDAHRAALSLLTGF